ncbi:MAG: DUF5107 domain-containing protein, partial [Anaerolineae bacterium]|nr:DUF5107 domain-containing protein [Anaerolineae bacterium]
MSNRKKCFVRLMLVPLFLIVLSILHPNPGEGLGEHRSPTSARARNLNATIFYTTTITILTYPYADYLYDAYNATYNITYPKLDWVSYNAANPTPVPQDYELLVMENDYLIVTVLPELGGRVYQLIDKATGQNHLYQNSVIKPTHWGPPEQEWWMAVGGIEWCLPVDEHGYESAIPWDWMALISSDGVTVTV